MSIERAGHSYRKKPAVGAEFGNTKEAIPQKYKFKETGEIVKAVYRSQNNYVIELKDGMELITRWNLRKNFEHLGDW